MLLLTTRSFVWAIRALRSTITSQRRIIACYSVITKNLIFTARTTFKEDDRMCYVKFWLAETYLHRYLISFVRDQPGRIAQSVGHQGSWVRYPVWQHTFVSPSAFSSRAVVSYWRKYVHEVLVNRLGGLSLPRKSVVRLTDRPDMTLDVYRGRKTTIQRLGPNIGQFSSWLGTGSLF